MAFIDVWCFSITPSRCNIYSTVWRSIADMYEPRLIYRQRLYYTYYIIWTVHSRLKVCLKTSWGDAIFPRKSHITPPRNAWVPMVVHLPYNVCIHNVCQHKANSAYCYMLSFGSPSHPVKTDVLKTVQIKRNNNLYSLQLHVINNFILTEPKLAPSLVKFPACVQ